ncbi:hypothetical protein [Bacillus sp. FJAT-29814]|uniref:hypothetical protein n=1 Tax=Bacillus sp. FJAT-29814 TaxID=1729688 RepID=UPI00082E0253
MGNCKDIVPDMGKDTVQDTAQKLGKAPALLLQGPIPSALLLQTLTLGIRHHEYFQIHHADARVHHADFHARHDADHVRHDGVHDHRHDGEFLDYSL